jgi:protein-L-isoaspartate O-methyltransferase
LAYGTTTLVTKVDADGRAVSSSTKPDLMIRMLEILDLRDEHTVLEIGTGTGYNVALLSERLGPAQVFSIDVDAELITAARARLSTLGRPAALGCRDGAGGWPEHAPYERIMATCSVHRVPWSWAEQLTTGGKLLADLKIASSAGNLVLLDYDGSKLEGRFTGRWAAFMSMRAPGQQPPSQAPRAPLDRQRTTHVPAQPWNTEREAWLLACLSLPQHLRHGYAFHAETHSPRASTLTAPDGSWAEVALAPNCDGSRAVRVGGDTDLWSEVERAYLQWVGWGRPRWERFGLTVTPLRHDIWLDEPSHVLHISPAPTRTL